MLNDVNCLSLEALVGEVAKIKVLGYRFVTLSVAERDADTFDIFYHFDKNLTLRHFKLNVSKGVPVPSITPVYSAAFLVENEIQDLFGIRFEGLVVDYERTLYLEPETNATPFCRCTVIRTRGVESIPDPATVPTDR
jgi:ech hydrogenase subunit D